MYNLKPGALKKGKVVMKKREEIKEQMVGRLGRIWHSLVELVKQGPR